MARQELETFIATHNIDMRCVFIPWSKSRNAPQPGHKDADKCNGWRSLNWTVTITRGDRDVATFSYGAGEAHAPAAKRFPHGFGKKRTDAQQACVDAELETGFEHRPQWDLARRHVVNGKRVPILPDLCDVLSSLALDASILDAGSFEEWAADCGYDTDSRAAEAIFRQCLDTALKLRRGLGDRALSELMVAAQDY